MGFKCGIVGLPNVGKSTLFNALTQTAAAEAANYPFCTIEPNIGDVGVPDERLDKLSRIGKSAATIPTRLTFVDIAGLVRGASKGEGLRHKVLAPPPVGDPFTLGSLCLSVPPASPPGVGQQLNAHGPAPSRAPAQPAPA